jgi:hypothetical protein
LTSTSTVFEISSTKITDNEIEIDDDYGEQYDDMMLEQKNINLKNERIKLKQKPSVTEKFKHSSKSRNNGTFNLNKKVLNQSIRYNSHQDNSIVNNLKGM